MKKKVLIQGPILTQSGYGEHARMVYRALKSREDLFEVYVNPINWGKTSWLWEDTQERRDIDEAIAKTQIYGQQRGQFDIAMLVTIPTEWEKYRAAPINIGVTAGIESNKVAPKWLEAGNQFVDKIIVPSEFAKKTYGDTTYQGKDQFGNDAILKLDKTIEVVNYPIKNCEEVDLGIKLDYDFNFLTVAQWGPRKNVENTIRWFVEEFVDQEIGLVLKLNRANNSIIDKESVEAGVNNLLAEYPDRKCKVYVLHGYMTENEMHSLYKHPQIKSLLSLTHGEGFGLPLFEAAYSGLPIVTHDWGGQTDFLMHEVKNKKKTRTRMLCGKVDYDLQPIQKEAVWDGVLQADSLWAFPKQGSAKMKMREVVRDYGRFWAQAKKLKSMLQEDFSEEKIHEKLVETVYGEETSEDMLEWQKQMHELEIL